VPVATEMIIDDEDRNFTTLDPLAAGNWVVANGALSIVAGGVSGNAMKCIKDAVASALTIDLASTDITALVVGNYYVLSFWAKYAVGWDGGVVTVTMGNYSTTFTPTTSWQRVTLRFQADETAVGIAFTSASVPTNLDQLWFDTFTLSDCVLVVSYHAVPEVLTADGDTPPAPLYFYQMLIVNKAIVMLNSISPVDVTLLDRAMALLEQNMQDFKRAISGKGTGQPTASHSNRY